MDNYYLKSTLMTFLSLLLTISISAYFPSNKNEKEIKSEANLRSSWMIDLPDNRLLSKLSLPGTHDSMSRHGGIMAQTQDKSLSTQLNEGIRVLDIRVRRTRGSFAIHHGPIYQKVMFGDVLNTVSDFLKTNPSETVLMRLKDECTGSGGVDCGPEPGSDSFGKIFGKYYENFSSLFWENRERKTNPTLGEIRGKVVLLRDNGAIPSKLGLKYGGDLFHIQDDYDPKGTLMLDAMYEKWKQVKKKFGYVDGSSNDYIDINYLSANKIGVPTITPHQFAWGAGSDVSLKSKYPDFPSKDCLGDLCTITAEGMNKLAEKYIEKHVKDRVGIVMLDFPSKNLVNKIINLNINDPVTFGYVSGRGFVDIDGDGKDDYCRVVGDDPNEFVECAYSTGTSFYGYQRSHIAVGYKDGRFYGDVNGDGKEDYCRVEGGGNDPYLIGCNLSDGKIFNEKKYMLEDGTGYWKTQYLTDINGDGFDDFCRVVGSKGKEFIQCSFSNGSNSFNKTYNSFIDTGYKRFFGDLNNDGKSDFCSIVGNKPDYKLMCAFSDGEVLSNLKYFTLDVGYWDGQGLADMNGDGKDDYCRVVGDSPNFKLACNFSEGNAFGEIKYYNLSDAGYNSFRFYADVNGNGTDEYCTQVGDVPKWIRCYEIKNGSLDIVMDARKRAPLRK